MKQGFTRVERDGLIYYQVAAFTEAGLSRHASATRLGGVSRGRYFALNLGLTRGDEPEAVRRNYAIICRALDSDTENLVLARQEHKSLVLPVDGSHRGMGFTRGSTLVCDGLVTNTPGVTLTILTADCAPVFLLDTRRAAVGLIHAGWRGTALSIPEAGVRAMSEHFGSLPRDILAAVGPCIGACCFETGAEVAEAMRERYGAAAEPYLRAAGEKYRIDLAGLAALSLQRAGLCLGHITLAGLCTCCMEDEFYSHRRMGEARGTMASFISL